jgi:hypothetical protein
MPPPLPVACGAFAGAVPKKVGPAGCASALEHLPHFHPKRKRNASQLRQAAADDGRQFDPFQTDPRRNLRIVADWKPGKA